VSNLVVYLGNFNTNVHSRTFSPQKTSIREYSS